MGRHSGSPAAPAAPAVRHDAPVPQEIEFATVPWVQEERSRTGAPTWTPAHRPMPPITPASVQRQRTGPIPVPPAPAPASARGKALPPEHRPIRASGTPATDAIPVQVPQWEAPSLSTGQIAVVAAPAGRLARRVRIGLGLAALAVLLSVVVQIVVQGAGAAERPAPSGVGATAQAPEQTVGGGAFITQRP